MTGSDQSSTIAVRFNLAVTAVAAAASFALLCGAPLTGPALCTLLLLGAVLLTTTHWALIHEAVHGNLHSDRRINELLGRTLGVLFLAPFGVLRFGHLSHHALNSREAERPELYVPPATPATRAFYFVRLLGGLYLVEVVSSALSFLPRRRLGPVVRKLFYENDAEARFMAERAERQLLEPASLRAVRIDAALILCLLGTGLWLYAAAWPLLLLALLGRGFLVSFMDNAAHYGGALDDHGQGFDLALPRAVRPLVLNANLHGTHHRHPNLPWSALPEAFARDGAPLVGSYLLVPWRQLGGPIRADSLPRGGAGRRAA